MFYRSPVQKTQGFSLIELLLALGVLAILLLAAFVVYPQVSLKNKVNKDLLNIQAAVAMFQSTYGVRGDYAGLDASTFASMPNFPKELVDPTKTTGFGILMGGTLSFSATGPDPANPSVDRQNRLMVQIAGMDPEICVPFSTAAARMANGDLFVSGPRGGTGLTGEDKRWDGKDPSVFGSAMQRVDHPLRVDVLRAVRACGAPFQAPGIPVKWGYVILALTQT